MTLQVHKSFWPSRHNLETLFIKRGGRNTIVSLKVLTQLDQVFQREVLPPPSHE